MNGVINSSKKYEEIFTRDHSAEVTQICNLFILIKYAIESNENSFHEGLIADLCEFGILSSNDMIEDLSAREIYIKNLNSKCLNMSNDKLIDELNSAIDFFDSRRTKNNANRSLIYSIKNVMADEHSIINRIRSGVSLEALNGLIDMCEGFILILDEGYTELIARYKLLIKTTDFMNLIPCEGD